MARTKQTARKMLQMDPRDWRHFQQTPSFPFKRGSEEVIRKYYPKSSKIFWKGLLHRYQSPDADESSHPNHKVLVRYKRDFFKSFSANWSKDSAEPASFSKNLSYLSIHNGSRSLLKKLIKANKRLKHIEFNSLRDELCSELVAYLKYCKNISSITFTRSLPFISEKTINSLRRSLGSTLQKVVIGGRISNVYNRKPKEFTRVMEKIFEFPKLKEIKFAAQLEIDPDYFPVKKLQDLQERNIACNLKQELPRGTSKSFLESIPEVSSDDYVKISMRNFWEMARSGWDKKAFENKRLRGLCRQVRDFDISAFEDFRLPMLIQRFHETSNLELVLSSDRAHEADYSEIKQLKNLKTLNLDIESNGEEEFLEDLFLHLSDAVEAHKKLEELILRVCCYGETSDGNESILLFFEDCAETLKKIYFEFRHSGEDSKGVESFYKGLGQLKNLQSFNILLNLNYYVSNERIEELSGIMLKMKSLEEIDLAVEKNEYGDKPINLVFPNWIKKLALAMDTLDVPFDPSTALWSLSNLTWLKLEFLRFNSPEWSKVIQDVGKLQVLEVLVLKQRCAPVEKDFIPQMTGKLDVLMKQCLNLKLIIFGTVTTQEVILFRRGDYPWTEVNSLVENFSYDNHVKVANIYHY